MALGVDALPGEDSSREAGTGTCRAGKTRGLKGWALRREGNGKIREGCEWRAVGMTKGRGENENGIRSGNDEGGIISGESEGERLGV